MQHVKQGCDEHEGELERFGDAGEKGGETSGYHQRCDARLVFRLGGVVNRQRRTGQAEHHDREETGLVAASDTEDGLAFGERLGGAEEVRDVVDAGDVEPEDAVKRVVQTNRNQDAIEEAVDAGADRAEVGDRLSEMHETAVDVGPDRHHCERDEDHHDRSDDGYQPSS